MTAKNPLTSGTATFCDECDEPYREIKRLPGMVGLCPTCFESAMGAD